MDFTSPCSRFLDVCWPGGLMPSPTLLSPNNLKRQCLLRGSRIWTEIHGQKLFQLQALPESPLETDGGCTCLRFPGTAVSEPGLGGRHRCSLSAPSLLPPRLTPVPLQPQPDPCGRGGEAGRPVPAAGSGPRRDTPLRKGEAPKAVAAGRTAPLAATPGRAGSPGVEKPGPGGPSAESPGPASGCRQCARPARGPRRARTPGLH